MGEVYQARDTKLDRDVALKLLPDTFAADPERLRRFEREAKTLASLDHPHIAQIYGVVDVDDRQALVMELVQGQTLDVLIQAAASRSRAPSPRRRGGSSRWPGFDVAADGRLLMTRSAPQTEGDEPRAVLRQNWMAALAW